MKGRLIVHLAPYLQGGAGRAIATLACAQQRGGDSVVVATSRTAEPGFENYPEYLDAIADSGATVVQVDSLFKRDLRLNAEARQAIEAALSSRLPEAIHAHAAIAARIGMTFGRPVVQTMHGWSRNKHAGYIAEDLGIMRDVDLVVFPSQASLEELKSIGGTFRATAIVPNGINSNPPDALLPDVFATLADARSKGTKILMSIGSLTPQKNQIAMVEALPALPGTLAVLVGEGPEMSRLSERASLLGVADRVVFCGYVRNASSALATADLLIQPSLTESFGVAVIEAFRAGVPVVASRIPALAELVGKTECGWTFNQDQSGDLVTVVRAALGATPEQRHSVSARARQLFLDRFTEDRMITAYDSIYRGLI